MMYLTRVEGYPDPRRPGKLLAMCWCACGRVYTAASPDQTGCPNPDCGKGAE